jgi:hypothetical protein
VLTGRAGEVGAGTFKPLADDPLFEAEPGVLEQVVELAAGDAVRCGDAYRGFPTRR